MKITLFRNQTLPSVEGYWGVTMVEPFAICGMRKLVAAKPAAPNLQGLREINSYKG